MADSKSGSKSKPKTKTPKRPKDYAPGFFSDYGGCGIIVTNNTPSSQTTKKSKKK